MTVGWGMINDDQMGHECEQKTPVLRAGRWGADENTCALHSLNCGNSE